MTLPSFDIALLHADREYLHAHPELSGQEHRTSEYLADRLTGLGIRVQRFGRTGLVGVLENGSGPVVAYRADMDGLPVREQTGLPFASKDVAELDGNEVPVMHACGHDVHMSVALAAAAALAGARDRWRGTVLFILQPAEEVARGAREMVDAGLWKALPAPEAVLGMHVMPYEAGKVFVPVGTAMSMGDSWRITVLGRGAHGSQPDHSIDPIVAATAMVMRLQTVVSREVGPRDTAVVTVGTFHAGLKENVIPDSAEFSVNIRTFDPAVRERVLAAVRRIVSAEAAASAAPEPLIEPISEFPRCYNDPEEARVTISHIRAALGDDAAVESEPHMASEDFGILGDAIGVPSVFWFLGGTPLEELSGPERVPVNHSPFFAPVAEPTLSRGVEAAVAALLARLDTGS